MVHDSRTTTRLLDGLHDPADDAVWQEFDGRYRPILIGVARKLGVPAEDAGDVAQETLVRFIREYREGKYERDRGRLRSWILGIARYRIADHFRAKAKARGWRGDSVIALVPEGEQLDEVWRGQRRLAILRHALDEAAASGRSNARTIRAFEMLAFHGRSAAEVAGELGMTLDDVYQAKNRIAARIRDRAQELERLYDDEAETAGPA